MKLTQVVPLITLALAGFRIPRNLADGQYTVEIPLLNSTLANYSAPLIRRQTRHHLYKRQRSTSLGHGQSQEHDHYMWVDPTINDPTDTPKNLESPHLQEPKEPKPALKNIPPPRLNNTRDDWDSIPVQVTHSECSYNQWPFKAQEYAQAREGLFSYCDQYRVQKRTMQISLSIRGDTAVYVCNWSKKRTKHCGRGEYEFVEEQVLDQACGQLQPGYAYIKRHAVTYGRAYSWDTICTWSKKKLHKVYWDAMPTSEDD